MSVFIYKETGAFPALMFQDRVSSRAVLCLLPQDAERLGSKLIVLDFKSSRGVNENFMLHVHYEFPILSVSYTQN